MTKTTTTVKPLAELQLGDEIRTNEGRPEWLRIVALGDGDEESRPALVEQCGGKRAGRQSPMNLHNYARGWTVRTVS